MKPVNIKFIQGTLLLVSFALMLSSCLLNDDLMTADAKTGGLVNASPMVQLVPKTSHNVDVKIKVYQGPAIQAIKVYKVFFHKASNKSSAYVLLGSINVNGQNVSDTLLLTQTFSWQQLKQGIDIQGYILPNDPIDADVGDYFMLKYVSVLDDGREVTSNAQTKILIANSYAGYYLSDLTFFHPNFGSYPNQPFRELQLIKELITADGSTCYTNFALWGAYGETITLTVNPDNSITFQVFGFDYIVKEGDPNNSLLNSRYDPLTGKIYLYYHYAAPGGNRIFWEILEPR